MRIFISYTTRDHRDRALVHRITEGLKARAVEVFYAPQSIRRGAEWKEVLRAELSTAAFFQCIDSLRHVGNPGPMSFMMRRPVGR